MSFRDRAGFLRDNSRDISGSHTSSQDHYDIERNGRDRFRVSTPTTLEHPVAFNSIEQQLPPDYQNGHSTLERNPSMEYGGYQFVGHPRHRHDTSVLLNDEVISGSLTNGNRMSPVRRFFCLLVTFDFLFTGLLWVITVIVSGGSIEDALIVQVFHYGISCSMFDIVILAFVRFAICIVFYALFDLKHWWPIAVTTTGSSIFLIVKVFFYLWNKYPKQLSLDVTLVLLSFILSWGEMWFLDFRVLPLENRAKEVLTSYGWLHPSERTRLIPSSGETQQNSGILQRYMDSRETASVTGTSNFYSPLASPENSDDDDSLEGDAMDHRNRQITLKNQNKAHAKEMLHSAWKTLTSSTDWKYEKSSSETGDVIASRQSEEGRKIFKLTGQLDIPARILLEEVFYRVEDQPSWNQLTTECKIVKSVDRNTDIMYQVCAEGGGGAVSVRDFVYLRHWELVDGVYVCAMTSTKHSNVPEKPKRVRGESGPCCFAISQSDDVPNKCNFRWTLNTDLKIRLPKFILDNAIMNSQFTFMAHLRKRIEELKDELSLNDSI